MQKRESNSGDSFLQRSTTALFLFEVVLYLYLSSTHVQCRRWSKYALLWPANFPPVLSIYQRDFHLSTIVVQHRQYYCTKKPDV